MTKFNTPAILRFIPGKGTTFIPNAYYRHSKEGFSEGQFNSHGFRDYERTYEKPTDVFRILVLGDSFVEALQVPLEDSFTAQLEKMLNGARVSSSRFEVLALGQSGFGTADEHLRYLNFGAAYNPDLVILAFFTGNDFRNNSKFLNRENVAFYYEFDEKHDLVLDRSLIDAYEESLTYPKRLLEELKRKSHLLSLISERVYLFRRQLVEARMTDGHKGEEGAGDDKRQSVDLFSDLNMYRADLPTAWRESVEVTKGIILRFRKSVEERGGRFLLLGLSSAEQVHPEVGNERKSRYRIELDYDQPDRILEEFARRNSIPFLSLMPAFREYHIKTRQYLHGFGPSHGGHWNRTGHRLAAELTWKFLTEQKLVPLENKTSRRL
ncbi:MAG: SGNH/GDSL hydrolase family protein [Nitrospira sp.]|nr:SGNH/GDSL hydrolase family protein [Nitrospira sp.]MDH4245724.1 SGNH/GDSL hydrolase family protein [Nitrospira sp.]MDH4355999.1 SGNH/GDSL hydrolase family protein [Nitrospira sp.]MDH5317800.1 SGNH/GDSL hydrolase family protein [Nitrospira sp.]